MYYRRKYLLGLDGCCVSHDGGGDCDVGYNDSEDACVDDSPSLVGEPYSPSLLVNHVVP